MGRVPPQTPERFQIVADLMASNHNVTHDAVVYQVLHCKLRSVYPPEELDRPSRDVNDENDYGIYTVIAIPAVRTCGECGGPLEVKPESGRRAFFYRQNGDAVEGRGFSKRCCRPTCAASDNGTELSYSFWTDHTKRRRMYEPGKEDFDPYDQEWHQLSDETFFETLFLRQAEKQLYYGHNGFLTQINMHNTTHRLTRAKAPSPERAASGGPSSHQRDDQPTVQGSLRRLRFAPERRRLQQAMFSRRVHLFVFRHVPLMCAEITVGTEKALDMAIEQVKPCRGGGAR